MFQAIEMIKQVETEAQNETKHVTKKTHKGEVEVDEEGEEDMSALADEVKLVNGFEHLCNSYIRILTRNYRITYINALQNRCYMCNPWTQDMYSVVITRQSNPPISQFSRPCNEF